MVRSINAYLRDKRRKAQPGWSECFVQLLSCIDLTDVLAFVLSLHSLLITKLLFSPLDYLLSASEAERDPSYVVWTTIFLIRVRIPFLKILGCFWFSYLTMVAIG